MQPRQLIHFLRKNGQHDVAIRPRLKTESGEITRAIVRKANRLKAFAPEQGFVLMHRLHGWVRDRNPARSYNLASVDCFNRATALTRCGKYGLARIFLKDARMFRESAANLNQEI